MLKIYGLVQCTTSQKIKKYLEEQGLSFDDMIDIREQPPLKKELAWALEQVDGQYTKILNTSGSLYREMGLKDQLKEMDHESFIELLASNGMLIKRPLIVGNNKATAGSKIPFLDKVWLS